MRVERWEVTMIRVRSRNKQPVADTVAPDVYPTAVGADDHGLHVADEDCARCGRAIGPTDEARRTAAGDCVHLNC